MWLAIIHSVQESLLLCQGLWLACNHCSQEFCCPLCGLLWLQNWFAGGLGSKERPGSRSMCSVDAEEQHGVQEAWRPASPCRLGRWKWLVGRSPFQQTLSLSIQCLPSLCSQLPTEGPCQASTPSRPGRLCP